MADLNFFHPAKETQLLPVLRQLQRKKKYFQPKISNIVVQRESGWAKHSNPVFTVRQNRGSVAHHQDRDKGNWHFDGKS